MLSKKAEGIIKEASVELLLSRFTEREVRKGDTIIQQGVPLKEVFLPGTALLTSVVTFPSGRFAKADVIGSGEIWGLLAALAGARSPSALKARTAGTIYVTPTSALLRDADVNLTLRSQLLSLANDYQAQTLLAIACATLHHATARLAHFLIASVEKSGQDEVRFTQKELASFLGVQRTTVNASATDLKSEGAIRYARGKISILDRNVLEQHCCECRQLGT